MKNMKQMKTNIKIKQMEKHLNMLFRVCSGFVFMILFFVICFVFCLDFDFSTICLFLMFSVSFVFFFHEYVFRHCVVVNVLGLQV